MGLSFRHKYNRYKGIPLIQRGDGYKGYPPKQKKGQRGKGFGSFFKNMAMKAAPHLKSFAKNTVKDLAPLAANTMVGMLTAKKGTRKDLAKASLKQALKITKKAATNQGKAAMGMSAFPPKSGRVSKKKGKKGKKKKNQGGDGIVGLGPGIGKPNVFFPGGVY